MPDIIPNWSAETWGALSVLGTLVIIGMNWYLIRLRKKYDRPQAHLSVNIFLESFSINLRDYVGGSGLIEYIVVRVRCNIDPRNIPSCGVEKGIVTVYPPRNIGSKKELKLSDV